MIEAHDAVTAHVRSFAHGAFHRARRRARGLRPRPGARTRDRDRDLHDA
jgi:hypothetical protein